MNNIRKTMIEIELAGPLSPADLPELLGEVEKALPERAYEGIVIISGRLPVWAASGVAHLCHPARGVAHFDPRLGGGVLVQAHAPGLNIGDIVPTEGAEVVKVSFGG